MVGVLAVSANVCVLLKVRHLQNSKYKPVINSQFLINVFVVTMVSTLVNNYTDLLQEGTVNRVIEAIIVVQYCSMLTYYPGSKFSHVFRDRITGIVI